MAPVLGEPRGFSRRRRCNRRDRSAREMRVIAANWERARPSRGARAVDRLVAPPGWRDLTSYPVNAAVPAELGTSFFGGAAGHPASAGDPRGATTTCCLVLHFGKARRAPDRDTTAEKRGLAGQLGHRGASTQKAPPTRPNWEHLFFGGAAGHPASAGEPRGAGGVGRPLFRTPVRSGATARRIAEVAVQGETEPKAHTGRSRFIRLSNYLKYICISAVSNREALRFGSAEKDYDLRGGRNITR